MNNFIFPGNPPAKYFYQLWCDEIQEVHPHFKYQIADYPRFSDEKNSQKYFLKLEDSLVDQIQAYLKTVDGPVNLIGHSLGGYLSLQTLKRVSQSVDRVFLLHPFIGRPQTLGFNLLKSVRLLSFFKSLDRFLAVIHPYVARAMAAAQFITPEEVLCFRMLAYHEFEVVAQRVGIVQIESDLHNKIQFYSCNDDTWCPAETIDALKKQISHFPGNAAHDFIVHKEQRKMMTDFIFKISKS